MDNAVSRSRASHAPRVKLWMPRTKLESSSAIAIGGEGPEWKAALPTALEAIGPQIRCICDYI